MADAENVGVFFYHVRITARSKDVQELIANNAQAERTRKNNLRNVVEMEFLLEPLSGHHFWRSVVTGEHKVFTPERERN